MKEHIIKLKPEHKIIKSTPYRMSPENRTKLRKELNNLLQEGTIEPTVSEWSSPVIVVPKPDKTIRAIIDFRKANLLFLGNSFPITRIDDLIQQVGQARYLSKFYLTKGFYQIPLAENSKKFTAFCTPNATFQFTTLPFGLKTSPTYFESAVHLIIFLLVLKNFASCILMIF